MTRYIGGTKAAAGYYWNPRAWNIETIEEDGGVLAGTAVDRYLRVPMLAMIPLALLISFLFVVFMPFIGLALVAWAIALKVASLRHVASRAAMAALAPAWQPGEAYFAGKADAKPTEPPTAPPPLAELEAEIATARTAEPPVDAGTESGPDGSKKNS